MLKHAGPQVTEVIWEPLLKGKFDEYFDKVSMAWLWARIHIRAQSREVGGEKLGYFNGGFQTFTDTLVAKLKELGVKIETGIDIVSIDNDKKDSVVITFADGKQKKYDACVATTPSHVFAKLVEKSSSVTDKYLTQLRSINYLGARLMIFHQTKTLVLTTGTILTI